MKNLKHLFLTFVLVLLSISNNANASIEMGDHRFSLSGGAVVINNQTSFALGAEYEYRVKPLYGIGAQANYVFSSSAFTLLSAPIFFLHPLEGDWYISAAPVFYLSSSTNKVGARFTTRMPLSLGIMSITPTVGVDVISGGPNYILGLAIGI